MLAAGALRRGCLAGRGSLLLQPWACVAGVRVGGVSAQGSSPAWGTFVHQPPLGVTSRGFSAGGSQENKRDGEDKRSDAERANLIDEEAFRNLRGSTRVHTFESQSSTPEYALVEAAQATWRQLKATLATQKIKTLVEEEFDPEEFVDQASNAFVTVNGLLGSGDLDALKPMLCPRLHAAFVQVHEEYTRQGLSINIEVEEVREATVDHMKLLPFSTGVEMMTEPASTSAAGEASAAAGDALPDLAARGGGGAETAALADACARLGIQPVENSAGWLVVGVRFLSQERSQISNVDNGMVVADSTDRRGHVWHLIRGPLPPLDALPAPNLSSCPWQVLDLGPTQAGTFVEV